MPDLLEMVVGQLAKNYCVQLGLWLYENLHGWLGVLYQGVRPLFFCLVHAIFLKSSTSFWVKVDAGEWNRCVKCCLQKKISMKARKKKGESIKIKHGTRMSEVVLRFSTLCLYLWLCCCLGVLNRSGCFEMHTKYACGMVTEVLRMLHENKKCVFKDA